MTRRLSCQKCGYEREVDTTRPAEKDSVRLYYCPQCSGPRTFVHGRLQVEGLVPLHDKFGLT